VHKLRSINTGSAHTGIEIVSECTHTQEHKHSEWNINIPSEIT